MNSNSLDFTNILTYSIQDIGNSLSVISSTLENSTSFPAKEELLYETNRVHNAILHIYQLYQINNNNYQINLGEFCIRDFLEEQILQCKSLLKAKDIAVDIQCEPGLLWFFDEILINGIVNDVLVSATRYAKKNIILRASLINDYLKISIEDDSAGFQKNLFVTEDDCKKGIHLNRSHIGLSIYYALRIAQIHSKNEKKGYITINNNSPLRGGCCTIMLP